MKQILLIGFGPFGQLETNPSERLVRWLHNQSPALTRMAILPTSYRRATSTIRNLIQDSLPRAIVIFGFSRRAQGFKIERLAHNADRSRLPDIDGMIGHKPIARGAPDTHRSPIDTRRLAELLQSDDSLPVTLSDDAGGYVCNHVYFIALHETRSARVPCILIHILDPPTEDKWTGLRAATEPVVDWLVSPEAQQRDHR